MPGLRFFITFYLLIVVLFSSILYAEETMESEDSASTFKFLPLVRIGVLAFRSKPQTLEQWKPLGALLSRAIPQYDFVVEALTYPELNEAVAKKQLDFVLTNSGHYILLKKKFELSSPLATLATSEHGEKTTHFGGVIFTQAKEKIDTLEDIKGKMIAVVNQESLGGYQMQAYELLKKGVHLPADAHIAITGMPHDNVVETVLSGKAQVGFVRSGILENMADEGKLDMKSIKIINPQNSLSFPVIISTQLYPEWPFSALPHVNEKLSKNVLSVLFNLKDNDTALQDMHIYDFNIPASYSSVEEMLRTLRFPPFDKQLSFNLNDVWKHYNQYIMFFMIFFGFILVLGMLRLSRSNSALQKSLLKQKIQADDLAQFQQVIEQSPISIVITDLDGIITYANPRFMDITGYTKAEIIGHNPRFLKSGKVPEKNYTLLWEKLKNAQIWEGELINQRKNGSEYIEWGIIAPLHQSDGTITHYVAIKEDITERKLAEKRIYQLAFYDQLTTLPNRQKLLRDMEQKPPNACAIFNIDAFRQVNDLFGIEVGDTILKQLGHWFSELEKSAYRTGGDEFTLLFYETHITHEWLTKRISMILSFIEDKLFEAGDNITLQIRMRCGAAFGQEKLFVHADMALDLAKEKTISFYIYEDQHHIQDTYRHNINMATMIRKALINGDIICFYQPIFDIKLGVISKYESLVRMRSIDGTLIAPLTFLPIAKKVKLYPRITQAVVEQACTFFEHRLEEFSINLSIADIENEHTMQFILNTIRKTNTASRIVFEILESEGISNYDNVKLFIQEVRALGAKIAIDDFGSGYSNFQHILTLNVDYLKIDGSLIKDIIVNERTRIVVETIVDFAQKMGAKTIAEFVCNEEILQMVTSLGIDFAQGYYIGKPDTIEHAKDIS